MDSESKKFYWDVGNRIRDFRQRKRYTVEELSEMAGISTKYMYQIENGKASFSAEILYKIANSLEVSSDAILMDTDRDIGSSVLSEVIGRFTVEEKEYIKRIVLQGIVEGM